MADRGGVRLGQDLRRRVHRAGAAGRLPTGNARRAPATRHSAAGIRARTERTLRPMKKLDRALEFPTTRRDPDSGYTLHGRRFDDPYAWLERLDDPETQAWLAAQEAVTLSVLSAVPGRDWLRAAVARSRRYSQLSPQILAGPNGREFLWQADASEEKLKF